MHSEASLGAVDAHEQVGQRKVRALPHIDAEEVSPAARPEEGVNRPISIGDPLPGQARAAGRMFSRGESCSDAGWAGDVSDGNAHDRRAKPVSAFDEVGIGRCLKDTTERVGMNAEMGGSFAVWRRLSLFASLRCGVPSGRTTPRRAMAKLRNGLALKTDSKPLCLYSASCWPGQTDSRHITIS